MTTLGIPALLRVGLTDPSRTLSLFIGFVFISATASASGILTGSGKLFLGAYTALWYMSVQGKGALDYAGVFGGSAALSERWPYVAIALAALLLTALGRRLRARA